MICFVEIGIEFSVNFREQLCLTIFCMSSYLYFYTGKGAIMRVNVCTWSG